MKNLDGEIACGCHRTAPMAPSRVNSRVDFRGDLSPPESGMYLIQPSLLDHKAHSDSTTRRKLLTAANGDPELARAVEEIKELHASNAQHGFEPESK